MAKRTLEDVLATALRALDTGDPVSASRPDGIDPTPWLQLRNRLEPPVRLDASTHGRNHGRQRMFAALATPPRTGGFRMIPTFFTMVPKAAMLVVGGLVLTGSAVGASAAVGGPNLPVAALTAIGLHVDVQSSSGIGNAPDAAQTGKDHANGAALEGSANASANATAAAGINHAPDAAQTGKDHANERALLGSGNASAHATGTVTASVGIGNAPEAAQIGVDHANEHALLGAGNASADVAATATIEANVGIGNAPDAAQTGGDHAAMNASLGAGNGATVTITPAAGLTNAPDAAQVGIDHATSATVDLGIRRP